MAISESDPERRNLVVTALCFIIYFIAGGHIANDQTNIRLQVINVEFSEPEVLAIIAWFLLFWFALRYWQKHRNEGYIFFKEEIKSERQSKLTIWYLKETTKSKDYGPPNGIFLKRIDLDGNNRLIICYAKVTRTQKDENGNFFNIQLGKEQKLLIEGLLGFIFYVLSFLKLSILGKSIGTYYVPYVLFSCAIVLGLYDISTK